MANSSIFNVTIDCPSCGGQLRIAASDDLLRLRCPRCAHEFSHGIPDAEILDDGISNAQILAPEAAPAPTLEAASGAGAAMVEEKTGLGERIGCFALVVLLTLALNGCAWFLTPKQRVIAIEEVGGKLRPGREYHTTGPDYLLGLPAAMMRLAGMEPPTTITGPGGTIDVEALSGKGDGNNLILVNPTKSDVYYTPDIFGDDSALARGAKTGTTLIRAGTGAAVVNKTHGDWRTCLAPEGQYERFAMGVADRKDYQILAVVTRKPPEVCK